ncbi:hypothetical protein EW146_g9148 [Bondarzewia mesenterica]|uniref:Mitochondrial distribution and morphology protein 31 n=1 Tax=Bondarzewia mesenterica TaxID=1095465 RepID=A0A4S4L8M6_9AGAM|nr:hypothetical protein EW146_g9148 [Bondarzewia mesenterica]
MSFVSSSTRFINGTVNTSRILALRHSSHAANYARFDRYGAIRSFFTQPHIHLPSNITSTVGTRDRRSIIYAHDRLMPSILPFGRTGSSPFAKSFHATPSKLHDNKPPKNIPGSPTPSRTNLSETDKPPGDPEPPPNYDNYPRLFRRLAKSLPHVRRPTRDDFLNAANGFSQRMRVRFRWFFIRAFRKFNADDISAFITWFLVGQGLWILIGTTTFFSFVFAVANSLRLQAYIARAISDYLTAETGVTIIFESAIVPKWKDSRISFKNVYVTRRPTSSPAPQIVDDSVHRVALGYDVSNHPANHRIGDEEEDLTNAVEEDHTHADDDANWSMFDLNVDSIDVTLSLWRWLDGKGLIKDAVVKGVRGVLDRRSVGWSPNLDPASFRHIAQPGDSELESLVLEDVLITVYQPGGFRNSGYSMIS